MEGSSGLPTRALRPASGADPGSGVRFGGRGCESTVEVDVGRDNDLLAELLMEFVTGGGRDSGALGWVHLQHVEAGGCEGRCIT